MALMVQVYVDFCSKLLLINKNTGIFPFPFFLSELREVAQPKQCQCYWNTKQQNQVCEMVL